MYENCITMLIIVNHIHFSYYSSFLFEKEENTVVNPENSECRMTLLAVLTYIPAESISRKILQRCWDIPKHMVEAIINIVMPVTKSVPK